ncbi:MAG: hypothetical protein ACPG4S_03860 [Schleiferiaceae bacterium]|jgi:hypothetical protein|nr:MAG: Uncharacterised protein [Cryomorphaceae bacterium]
MEESNGQNEFYNELSEWKNEMVKDIDLITEGLKIQEEKGQAELLKFYRGLSYKILKWKKFVSETNASNLSK